MPIFKRSPEKWQAIISEVQQRSKRRKQKERHDRQKQRDLQLQQAAREAHKQKRAAIKSRLAQLNEIVRSGQFVTTPITEGNNTNQNGR